MLNKTAQLKSVIDKCIKNYFSTSKVNISASAQTKVENNLELMKWSNSGYLLKSPEENDAVLRQISSESKDNQIAQKKDLVPDEVKKQIVNSVNARKQSNISDCTVPDDIKSQIRRSVLKQKNSSINENIENGLTASSQEWKTKLKQFQEGDKTTPYSRLKESLDSFSKEKKYSSNFEKMPFDLSSNLSKINKLHSLSSKDKLYSDSVSKIAEIHSLDHKAPLIMKYNEAKFRWLEYQDSIANYSADKTLAPHINNINSEFESLGKSVNDIYSNPDNGSKQNIASMLSSSAKEDGNKNINLMISAKNKISNISNELDSVNELDQKNKFSLKSNETNINLNRNIYNLQDIAGSGEFLAITNPEEKINFLKNTSEYKNIESSLLDINSNCISKFNAAGQMNMAASLPKLPPVPGQLIAINSQINILTECFNTLLDSGKSCPEFIEPENMLAVKNLNLESANLKSNISELSALSPKETINTKVSNVSNQLSCAQTGFSDKLSSYSPQQKIDNINSSISNIKQINSDASISLDSKKELVTEQISSIQNNIDSLKEAVNSALFSSTASLDQLNNAAGAMADSINNSFCAADTSSLINTMTFDTPISSELILTVKTIYDTYSSLNLESPAIDDLYGSYVNTAIGNVDALKVKLMENYPYSMDAIKEKLAVLQYLSSNALEKYNTCCLIAADLQQSKLNINSSMEKLNELTQLPDPNAILISINDIKTNAFQFGSISAELPEYPQTLESLQNLQADVPDLSSMVPDADLSGLYSSAFSIDQPEFSAPQLDTSSLLGSLALSEACIKSNISFVSTPAQQALGTASGSGMLKCQNGIAPIPYQIVPTGEFYGPGETIGAVLAPTLWPSTGGCNNSANILSWTTLGVPPYPCVAMLHSPFSPGSSQVMVMKAVCNALIMGDKCSCFQAPGGQIEVFKPGQEETKLEK